MKKLVFEENIFKYLIEEKRLTRIYNQISTARILSFIAAFVAAIYFANTGNGIAVFSTSLLFLISFVALIVWHNKIKFRRRHAQFLFQINEDEVKRNQGDLSSFEQGNEFISIHHPYSTDLDVFGQNSLFQLLNRTTTITGKTKLASWLLTPASQQEISLRQDAVLELKNDIEFCQNFQAAGLHYQDKKADFASLKNWLDQPAVVLKNKALLIGSYLMPLISMMLLAGFIWYNITFGYLLVALLLNGLMLRKVFSYALKLTEQTSRGVSTLASISHLIKEVEKVKFQSAHIKSIQVNLSSNEVPASRIILRLVKILDFFNARANMFYAMFNFIFLFDLHLIRWAEKWRYNYGKDVAIWFDGISEFEVLASLAAFSYANEDFSTPTIVPDDYCFAAEELAHPLIKPNERIKNNFKVENKGQIVIITGSNMSGKSTFLRTIGINMVLAYAGAPVCASKLHLSIFQIFTGMRTQDDLKEHISSFYAELKRIEQLLHLYESSALPVLFMLDEILKGTNSQDRHKGATALVKQLHNTNSIGFVSTHDLELGEMATKLDYCQNYSFNSRIVEDKIEFDYKISDGICRSFNASALMKNIGIQIDN